MEKLQTASEWLFERLERMIPRTKLYDIDKKQYLERAKEIEKNQIMRAYMSGEIGEIYELKNTLTASQYYENNYEKIN